MKQPSPEQVRELLAAAMVVPEEQRDLFLANAAGADSAVVEEVRQLLALSPRAQHFMSRPLADIFAGTDSRQPLMSGTRLRDRYRLLDRIAVSGFATVYLASDDLLEGKQVVVKVIDQPADEVTLRAAFQSEVSALSRVHHPSVVGIGDVGSTAEGKPFVVLSYVPGNTLRDLMQHGNISLSRAFSLLNGIGKALAAAHKAGVWHLDIKPENVIVTDAGETDERVTLIDFGIARLKEASSTGIAALSLSYHAPEQLTSPGPHTDIYQLSLLAFELFTSRLPAAATPIEEQLPKSLGIGAIRGIAAGLSPRYQDRPASVDEWIQRVCEHRTPRASRNPWSWIAVAGMLAMLLAAVYFYKRSDTPAASHYDLPIPLAVSQEREHRPSLCPDGKHVYYEVGPQHQEDIYRKSVSGGEPVLIVGGPADESWPVISPDERSIVFRRAVQAGVSQLVLKHLPDGPEKVLLDNADTEGGSFSPDGEKVLFTRTWSDGNRQYQIVSVRTGKVESIDIARQPQCNVNRSHISPDGKSLAFTCRFSRGFDDLYVVPIDKDLHPSSPARRLTDKNERIESVDWAPDNRSILIVAGTLGNGVIKRVYLDRAVEPEIAPIPAERVEAITVARFANKIAYSKHLSDSNILSIPVDPPGEPHTLVATSYEDELPQYSPDGTKFIATSIRSGMPEVWIYDADGSNGRRLFSFAQSESGACVWNPVVRNQLLCSNSSRKFGYRILRGDYSTGEATPILSGFSLVNLSHDGKSLYVTDRSQSRRSIYRMSYPSMTERRLIADGAAYGEESLDGKWFYFSYPDPAFGVWKMQLPNGKPEKIIGVVRRRDNFALGRKGIYYISPRLPSTTQQDLFLLPYAGATPAHLFAFSKDIGWGVSLSPDQRTLLFTQIDSSNSDVMLVDNFR